MIEPGSYYLLLQRLTQADVTVFVAQSPCIRALLIDWCPVDRRLGRAPEGAAQSDQFGIAGLPAIL
ncbi:hypothetical protein CO683_38410 [Bradyrhizobium ottawaense]|nr:hypothetical protein [Bradyrhizobium sp. CCBAU 45394]MDA9490360.1 hypothetical protein [Bradyrhizobium sp. CCBAU 11361]MDA9505766.1 hypothetical protein [Bradyrhizobium sp. CCBAU 11386]MDA9537113.1 hypothetical protein [Bradyrhizobium sp. CCBAU 21362]PDT64369.1 hypothetical protein CO683_38410 [Bradyrhizobium ottawaense]